MLRPTRIGVGKRMKKQHAFAAATRHVGFGGVRKRIKYHTRSLTGRVTSARSLAKLTKNNLATVFLRIYKKI